MIQISVASTELNRITGNAKNGGKPYDLSFQEVWAHTYTREGVKNPYPEKLEIILDKDKDGTVIFYPVGEYQLHPSSLYIRDGKLAVAPRLIALKAKAA